jgi:hypothetical protein
MTADHRARASAIDWAGSVAKAVLEPLSWNRNKRCSTISQSWGLPGVGAPRHRAIGSYPPPDHPLIRVFEVRLANVRGRVGEVGHGVEAVEGEPGMPVGDDPFGGGGMFRLARRQTQCYAKSESREHRHERRLPFRPRARHSF